MKKLLILFAAAVLTLTASAAMAAVSGTPHDYTGNVSYGQCEVCHVPHAALGAKRLWRAQALVALTGTWTTSTIGQLCGTCHTAAGPGHTWTNGYGVQPHDMTSAAYAGSSHGRNTGTLTTNIRDAINASTTKPYLPAGHQIESGLMECTSCHNPHDDTSQRPFLRPGVIAGSISGVCADCHNRYNTALAASNKVVWSNITTSMHPINVLYAGGAKINILATPNAALRVTAGAENSANPWTLGGKSENYLSALSGTNNIGCGTCHAIHNPPTTTDATAQGFHLLAMDNTGANAGLCEGCHGGPASSSAVGGTAGDHPINVLAGGPGPIIDKWYNTAGSTKRYERNGANTSGDAGDWPRGSGGNIMCTSCHSAHAGTKAAALTRREFTSAGFCGACHSDPSPAGHHTHKYNTGPTSAWPGTPSKSNLDCNNCHGTSVSTGGIMDAHNGFIFTSGFANTNTVPAGQNNASQLCNFCHVGGKTDPTTVSAFPSGFPNPYVSNGGTTTHYLGYIAGGSGNQINVKRTAWLGGFSKYGAAADTHGASTDATGTTMVCESCHSVTHNIGTVGTPTGSSGYMNNLLLQDYKDDDTATGQGVGAGFCVACHNNGGVDVVGGNTLDSNVQDKTKTPQNMHPMTAWSITKAIDAGRTPTYLITGAGSYADVNIGGGNLPYPTGTNQMDCDTCHKPHRADNNGTWNIAYHNSSSIAVILEKAGPTVGRYDTLCTQCHGY